MACDLLRHELHVWLARPEPLPFTLLLDQYERLLNDEERQRCHRFHFEHDRKHFLAAHALLRLAIAHYLHCAPQDLDFVRGANGKPQLAPCPDRPPLSFNLSHTRGMVACAITLGRDCGIDVERIREMKQLEGVAETVFSDRELDYLQKRSVDESARLTAFFTLWTLKEAYIKATGLGMSAPLRQISIDPDTLLVEDHGLAPQMPKEWLFDTWQPEPSHALALACENAAAIASICYHEFNLAEGSRPPLQIRQILNSSP